MEEVTIKRETFIVQRFHVRGSPSFPESAGREVMTFLNNTGYKRMRGNTDYQCVSREARRNNDRPWEWYVELRFAFAGRPTPEEVLGSPPELYRPGGLLMPPVPADWVLVYDSRVPQLTYKPRPLYYAAKSFSWVAAIGGIAIGVYCCGQSWGWW